MLILIAKDFTWTFGTLLKYIIIGLCTFQIMVNKRVNFLTKEKWKRLFGTLLRIGMNWITCHRPFESEIVQFDIEENVSLFDLKDNFFQFDLK